MTTADALTYRRQSVGWSVAGAEGVFALCFAASVALAVSRDNQLPVMSALLVLWTVSAGMLLAPVGLIASGLLLALGYPRGNRVLFAALLAGGLAMLATIVVAVSPMGQTIMGALLD